MGDILESQVREKDIHTLIVHMDQARDILESQVREKDIHTLIVHMDQVRDIVGDLTRVEKDIHTLIVPMDQVKDILDDLTRVEKDIIMDRVKDTLLLDLLLLPMARAKGTADVRTTAMGMERATRNSKMII